MNINEGKADKYFLGAHGYINVFCWLKEAVLKLINQVFLVPEKHLDIYKLQAV